MLSVMSRKDSLNCVQAPDGDFSYKFEGTGGNYTSWETFNSTKFNQKDVLKQMDS